MENNALVITGEDPGDGDEDKPIRELHDFSIFDPTRRNELVTLEALEQDDGIDRAFEATGFVKPHYLIEEDEGQEEEPEEPQYVHLSAILRYTVDYTQESEQVPFLASFPMHILTMTDQAILHRDGVCVVHFEEPVEVLQSVLRTFLLPKTTSANNHLQGAKTSQRRLEIFSG